MLCSPAGRNAAVWIESIINGWSYLYWCGELWQTSHLSMADACVFAPSVVYVCTRGVCLGAWMWGQVFVAVTDTKLQPLCLGLDQCVVSVGEDNRK